MKIKFLPDYKKQYGKENRKRGAAYWNGKSAQAKPRKNTRAQDQEARRAVNAAGLPGTLETLHAERIGQHRAPGNGRDAAGDHSEQGARVPE